jgi:hypothetical protein
MRLREFGYQPEVKPTIITCYRTKNGEMPVTPVRVFFPRRRTQARCIYIVFTLYLQCIYNLHKKKLRFVVLPFALRDVAILTHVRLFLFFFFKSRTIAGVFL